MTRDFTFEMYERLLDTGLEAGYDHLTVREYLSRDEPPDRFVVHRHDVDRKPENALAMAELEAEYGISSTYYFRTIEKTFEPSLIERIESLGHEVGYHYEDLDRAEGDLERAHRSFTNELERLRNVATVETVCMHGNPLTKHDNRELWSGRYAVDDYDLHGEAYLSMDFTDVTYFSDTGRTWEDGALKIKDHPVGRASKSVQVADTDELIALLAARSIPAVCVLSHPNRWARTTPELVAETAKDLAVNVAKRGLNVVR